MLCWKHAEKKCFNTAGTLCFPGFLPGEISWILWCVLSPAEQDPNSIASDGLRSAGAEELPERRVLFQEKSPPGLWRGVIQRAFRSGVGGEGGRGTRTLPSQRFVRASGQEFKSKFKSSSTVPDPESLGVPLSRKLAKVKVVAKWDVWHPCTTSDAWKWVPVELTVVPEAKVLLIACMMQ